MPPTVGKRLWYWPVRACEAGHYDRTNQPYAALITHVHSDTLVNLAFFDRNGLPDTKMTVQLWHRGTPRPAGMFCEYIPDDIPESFSSVAESRAKLTLPRKATA